MNMNHTIDKHLLLLSGELIEAEAESVRAHLQQCATCRADADMQKRLLSAYAMTPLEAASDLTLARISTAANRRLAQQHVVANMPRSAPFSQKRVRIALAGCTVCVLVIAAVLTLPFSRITHVPARSAPETALIIPKRATAGEVSGKQQSASKTRRAMPARFARVEKKPIPITRVYSAMYHESSVDSDLRYMRSRLAHLALLVSDKDF